MGSTIQLENRLRTRSVSTNNLDVSVRPAAEQTQPQPAPEIRGVSPANSTRDTSASKLKSKRKLFDEEEVATSASEVVRTGDETLYKENVEEFSTTHTSIDVNLSVSEMDLTLQHQSVDASLNQSVLMSPANMSLLDDSLTSPSYTSKLNLSQLNIGSPTFKNKQSEEQLADSTPEKHKYKGTNSNNAHGMSEVALTANIRLLAASAEISKPLQFGGLTVNTFTPVQQDDSTERTNGAVESKLKVRSKSLTELFSQAQFGTSIAPPKQVAPAGNCFSNTNYKDATNQGLKLRLPDQQLLKLFQALKFR